jgi:hypothetical protein
VVVDQDDVWFIALGPGAPDVRKHARQRVEIVSGIGIPFDPVKEPFRNRRTRTRRTTRLTGQALQELAVEVVALVVERSDGSRFLAGAGCPPCLQAVRHLRYP